MYLGTRAQGLGVLNCPGDPGCPGNVQPGTPESPDVQQQIADLWDSIFKQGAAVTPGTTPPPATGFTDWLNANGKTLAIAGAVGFGLVLMAKAGR